jgi:hypothetical protein
VKNKQAQLKILQLNKEIIIKQHGEQAYDTKVNKLLTALLNTGAEDDPNVLYVSQGCNNEDEDAGVRGVSQVQEINEPDIGYI